MTDDLITPENISTEAIWAQPDEDFFIPTDTQVTQAVETAHARIDAAVNTSASDNRVGIVITDDDADGLGAYAILREMYDAVAVIPAGPHGVIDLVDALNVVAERDPQNFEVWVTDIRPDENKLDAICTALDDVMQIASVHWVDHHSWPEGMVDELGSHVTSMKIDDGSTGDDRCAAELLLEVVGNPLPDPLVEAIKVTSVYDCWKKDENDEFVDPRAPDLADYAEIAESPDEYADAITTYGADIADKEVIATALREYRDRMQTLNELALEKASFEVVSESNENVLPVSDRNVSRLQEEGVEDDEWVIALTYGNCDTNAVADTLGEQAADAVAILKPDGGLSLRSRGAFEQCNRVAACFNGGGHTTAAGAHLSEGEYGSDLENMVDYGEHWHTHGRGAKRMVRRAFRDVITDNEN